MHIWSILVALILILNYCDCETQQQKEECKKRQPVRKFCGNNLSGVLNRICRGSYAQAANQRSLRSLLTGRIRSHGVVNECCYNPCTPFKVLEYCEENLQDNVSRCDWIMDVSHYWDPYYAFH
uniref:Bombyxin B-2-like n=1 Tax=Diabrotica virgifera virgifera TaxID=50390 RepID=A0A6P7GIQ8_DIAVI